MLFVLLSSFCYDNYWKLSCGPCTFYRRSGWLSNVAKATEKLTWIQACLIAKLLCHSPALESSREWDSCPSLNKVTSSTSLSSPCSHWLRHPCLPLDLQILGLKTQLRLHLSWSLPWHSPHCTNLRPNDANVSWQFICHATTVTCSHWPQITSEDVY